MSVQIGWDSAKKLAEEHSGGDGAFFKLENDGDKAIVVICGDPAAREVVWIQGKGAVDVGTKEARKAMAADPDLKPGVRVKMNLVMFKTGHRDDDDLKDVKKPQMQIWEFGSKVFASIHKMRAKYKVNEDDAPFPFINMLLEIERNGAKGDNKTTYSILPDDSVSDEVIAVLKTLKLRKLTGDGEETEGGEKSDGKKGGKSSNGDTDDFDFDKADKKVEEKAAGPLDAEVANEITERLKKLPNKDPREAAKELLAAIGNPAGKIKEIPAKLKKEALAALASIEKAAAGGGAAEEEDDF